MLYYAYSGTKTREELIKLIDMVSTKPTSYQILNCNMIANATFNINRSFALSCLFLLSYVYQKQC